MRLFTRAALILLLTFISTNINAQFKDYGLKGGVQLNGVMPVTEFEDDNGYSLSSLLFRGFLRFQLSDLFDAEVGAGYGKLSGDDFNYTTMKKGTGEYEVSIIPIEARLLLSPFDLESVNPYLYTGIGMMNFSVDTKPSVVSAIAVDESGWAAIIPFGLGTEIKLSDVIALDLSAGFNYSLKPDFNYFDIDDLNDAYINFGAGISYNGESCSTDKDADGLTRCEEEQLGTDPRNADTDGDGLNDGQELKEYNTDPKNPDSDNDGLKDGEEVLNYKTNPGKADTDDDGLNDYDEAMTHKTDPLNPDTDGDGLKDGDEVLNHKTSPFKADTDSDGLKDGEEVMKYKTNPLDADTDDGTVLDGKEIANGTNPLDPKDDVPVTAVEKEISWENVLFNINSAKLTKAAKATLDAAYDNFTKLTDAKLHLSGHACSLGSDDYNIKLSEKRVNAVKEYLVKKGINADVIDVQAFGESKPAFPNDTEKERAKNRRGELKASYWDKP